MTFPPPEVPRLPRNLGCTAPDCGRLDTVWIFPRVGRRCAEHPGPLAIENVDPAAAFVILRAHLAWWIDERFSVAAGRWAS